MVGKSYFVMPLCANECLQNESSVCLTSVLQKPEDCKIFFRDKPDTLFRTSTLIFLQDPGTNFTRMVFKISI